MSQPQNLRADDLPHAPLTSRTTDIPVVTNPTTAPEPTEALMAVTKLSPAAAPVGSATKPALTAVPDAVPADAVQAGAEQASGQPDGAQPPQDRHAGRAIGRAEGPQVPEARAWGGRLAQAVSEVLAGDRPISQLVRFTDDTVFTELNRKVRLLGLNTTAVTRGAKEKSAVQSVRVFMPEPFIAEVAAHVRRGGRSRAIALRMEIRRNRWVCTALEIG
ncbi:Rv3235 family protein [Kribbella sp. NBC_00709]|uniref:Rv3235 family protein n=1 Tax=Kribbella sp. NBC_00709 TaxID=2975972 RepID=UPI002E2CFD86|nr:Rv3235 family protein [Kribbella sp. NBC_00709]